MFVLTSPDLPDVATDAAVGAIAAYINPPAPSSVGGFAVGTSSGDILEATGTTTTPSYTGSTITVTLPTDTVGTVTSVTVGGQTYNVQTPLDTSGYVYNPTTGDLTINLPSGVTPAVGGAIAYSYLASTYGTIFRTNEVPNAHPEIFYRWNISGQIQLSRQFEQSPSGSFQFITLASNEGSVRSSFQPNTKLDLYGHGYAVASLTVDRLSLSTYNPAMIRCSVSLKGKWDYELQKEIKIKDTNNQSNTQSSPSGGSGGTGGGATTGGQCSTGSTNFNKLGQKAGLSTVKGASPDIPVSNDTPSDATTTLDQELRDRARSQGGFVYYSDPSAPSIKPFGGSGGGYLSPADIWGPGYQISWAGTGATYTDPTNGEQIQLSNELENTELELDEDPDTVRGKAARDIYLRLIEGDRAPEIPPSGVDEQQTLAIGGISLRETSACFDSGGKTKTRKVVTRLNGQTLTEETTTWGFAFSSLDVYDIESFRPVYKGDNGGLLNVSQFWKVIEESTTTYNYDDNDDYLTSVVTRGWRLSRFRQEQNLDAVLLQAALSEDLQTGVEPQELARRQEVIKLYTQFFKLPIDSRTSYTLENHRSYYPDVKKPQAGTSEASDWVEPKFAIATTKTDNSYQVRDNPESTAAKPLPPISCGRNFREVQIIDIAYPPSGISEDKWRQESELYRTKTLTTNQEGQNLRNALTVETFADSAGRPGIHTRLAKVKPDPCAPPNGATPQRKPEKVLLNTAGSTADSSTPSSGTLKFKSAAELEAAVKAAKTEVAIANSRDAEQVRVRVAPCRFYNEGDTLNLNGATYVIFGITETMTVTRAEGTTKVISDGWELQLGRLITPNISVTRMSI